MKKTLLTLTLSLSCIVSLLAQESKNVAGSPIGGIVIGRPKKNPGINISVSANGGSSTSAGVSNSVSLNPNLNLELVWSRFGIGLDAGVFRTKPDPDFSSYSAPLKSIDMIAVSSTRDHWTSTYILVGPQYTFGSSAVHKIAVTLSAKGGIGINKAPDLFVTDKEMNQQPIAEYRAPSTYKQNAFVFKPGATFAYWLTGKLAFHVNVQYLLQTGQDEFDTRYKDLSKVDFKQAEAKQIRTQIQGQPFVTAHTKGPASYFSAGIGITYSILKHSKETSLSGKSISEKGVSSTKGRPRSSVSNEDDELAGPVREAREKVKNVSIKVSEARKIILTNQQLEKLFTPLASEGFIYNSTSIIAYQGSNYLVAVFENTSTKAQETIGLPMHENEGAAFVAGNDKPIKCGFNIYCKCDPPLCLGCTRPGGTTVEQCGFAKSGSAMQLVAYFAVFADLGK